MIWQEPTTNEELVNNYQQPVNKIEDICCGCV